MKYIFNPFSGVVEPVLDKASEISNSPSGNLAATTVQGALNELQTDIDTINTDIADDVEGPASSTNNGFAKFDGTTGKLLKDSPATISNADVDAAAAIAYSKLAALTASRALVSDVSGVVSAATTTSTEIGYVNGVTSAIQTQLDAKASTTSLTAHTGASSGVHGVVGSVVGTSDSQVLTNKTIDADSNTITNIENADIKAGAAIAVNKLAALTASRAVVADGSGFISAATTTSTEIGYVNGVTSAIQTQLDAKQAKLRTIVSVSTNVTLTTNAIHLVNTSSARSLTLPSPVSGTEIIIKDVTGSANVNNITVVRFGSEQIEGASASYTMDQTYQSITLIADGTNWWII